MEIGRIDFISAYCDRWCERCAFTSRCSTFACTAAIAMCGDAEEGFELAVGHPRSPGGSEGEPEWHVPDFDNQIPTDEEMAEFSRLQDARRKRIEATPLSRMAWTFTRLSYEWIQRREELDRHIDPIVREAFQIACWDSSLITVKLHRAMDGHDRFERHEEEADAARIQNDWNGSAKVAILSIQRSLDAWTALGSALGDAAAASLADALSHLHRAVIDQFPDAMKFVRPGFDDIDAAGVSP
jgi:hypothetical protein